MEYQVSNQTTVRSISSCNTHSVARVFAKECRGEDCQGGTGIERDASPERGALEGILPPRSPAGGSDVELAVGRGVARVPGSELAVSDCELVEVAGPLEVGVLGASGAGIGELGDGRDRRRRGDHEGRGECRREHGEVCDESHAEGLVDFAAMAELILERRLCRRNVDWHHDKIQNRV